MILFVVSENVLCFKCKSSPKQTNKQTKLFKNYHFIILTKFYYSSRDPDWSMAVRAREEWLRVTVMKIGEVVEEDHELKRFMLSVEVHARENGLIWPEICSLNWVDLKEALGGGSGGAQFATALRRLAKVDEEERLQQGGFQCSCGEIFAFQRYQICHEKKHQRNIEIEQQRTKNNVGQFGAKDDPIELSDAEEEEEKEEESKKEDKKKKKKEKEASPADEDGDDDASKLGFEVIDDEEVGGEGGTVKTAAQKKKEKKAKQLQKLKEEKEKEKKGGKAQTQEDKKPEPVKEDTPENEGGEGEGEEDKDDKKGKKKKGKKEKGEEEAKKKKKPNKAILAAMAETLAKQKEEEERLRAEEDEKERLENQRVADAIEAKRKEETRRALKKEREKQKKEEEKEEEKEEGEVGTQNEVVREAQKKRKTVTIPCKECELKFDRKGRLEKHMNAVHLKVNSSLILCNTCGRGFRLRANFEKHERTSSACELGWKCEPCKKVFSSKQKLDVHLKSACHAKVGNMQGEAKRKSENGESDEFEDEEKEEEFEDGEKEEGEVRDWLYNQEGFVCPFCETRFESEKVFGEHINSQHKGGFGDKNIAGEELDEDDEYDENAMDIGEYDELNTQEDEEDKEEEVKKEVKKARKRRKITDIADQLMEKKACLPKSKYLPEGWTFRIKKKGWIIMTSDKTRLESYIAVQRYMFYKGGFTKNEMKKVYMFPDGLNHQTRQNEM